MPVELLTFWHITILPSGGTVGGVTPRPLGCVIWIAAVVIGGFQNLFGELGDIIPIVFVRALAVPALTGFPGFRE